MNRFDTITRRVMIFSKMFTKSWGRPGNLKEIKDVLENIFAKRLTDELIERTNPKMIITKNHHKKHFEYVEGFFKSPLSIHSPNLFPSENTAISHFKGLFNNKNAIGTVILLAPTGDHTYFLRQFSLADDLLEKGVNTILIENPFYGRRKPKEQFRSALENVADLYIMGAALITEAVLLFKWVNDSGKYPKVNGLSGVSLGGFNASLTATNINYPVAAVPCLTWSSAAPIFTMGTLSQAINWPNLEAHLEDPRFREEIQQIPNCDWLDKLHSKSIGDENFTPAQRFMWILMNQYTSLEKFAKPLNPELAKFIIGEKDAYIDRRGVPDVREVWPGCDVQIIPNIGHVQGFLQHSDKFRDAILEMLAKTDAHLKAKSNA